MKQFIAMVLIVLACLAASLAYPFTGYAANRLITGDPAAAEDGTFRFVFHPGYGPAEDSGNAVTTDEKKMKFYSLLPGSAGEIPRNGPFSLQSLWMNDKGKQREERKWLLFQDHGFRFELKPGVAFHDDGIGEQDRTHSLFLAVSKETGPWAFRLDAGYIRNENDLDERKDLWRLSLTGGLQLSDGLRLVGRLGMERSPLKDSLGNEAFLTGGAVYSLRPWLDLDMGIRAGFSEAVTDWAVLSGITIRF